MEGDQTYPWKRKAAFRHVPRKSSRRARDPHLSVQACVGDSRVWGESLWNFPFLHQNEAGFKLTATLGIVSAALRHQQRSRSGNIPRVVCHGLSAHVSSFVFLPSLLFGCTLFLDLYHFPYFRLMFLQKDTFPFIDSVFLIINLISDTNRSVI